MLKKLFMSFPKIVKKLFSAPENFSSIENHPKKKTPKHQKLTFSSKNLKKKHHQKVLRTKFLPKTFAREFFSGSTRASCAGDWALKLKARRPALVKRADSRPESCVMRPSRPC